MIPPTTPTGSRTTRELPTSSSHTIRSTAWAIAPKSIAGSPAWMVRDRPNGIPTSRETIAAISSARAASPWEMAVQASTRSASGVADQPGKAARAARAARSTSSGVPSGTRPMTSSVVASITSIAPSPAGGVHSPPM